VGTTSKFWLQKFVNDEWQDVGDPQATIKVDAGDGNYCIVLNTDLEIEAMVLPLPPMVRLVVDTGVGCSLKVTRVTLNSRI
jgi:hypothetical protein